MVVLSTTQPAVGAWSGVGSGLFSFLFLDNMEDLESKVVVAQCVGMHNGGLYR